jgi:hypothetical protein
MVEAAPMMATRKRTKLTQAAEVITVLGGYREVARMYGESPRTVSNWISRGLPSDLHWSLSSLLKKRGYAFDPAELFGQRRMVEK